MSNALTGLQNGESTAGDPNSPTYYQRAPQEISMPDAIVTGFPAWNGYANPGTVFGPAFASELGNRVHFGLAVEATDGTTFTLADLSFVATSSDPANLFGFARTGYTYDGRFLGFNGSTAITSGNSSQVIDRLYFIGSGTAAAAYCPGCTIQQQQDAINQAAAGLSMPDGSPLMMTGTYTIGQTSASGSIALDGIPEPSTWSMLALALTATGCALWRKRI